MHTYYMFSLNSFIYFFLRGISTAGIKQEEVITEGEEVDPMDEVSLAEGSVDGGSSVGGESIVGTYVSLLAVFLNHYDVVGVGNILHYCLHC